MTSSPHHSSPPLHSPVQDVPASESLSVTSNTSCSSSTASSILIQSTNPSGRRAVSNLGPPGPGGTSSTSSSFSSTGSRRVRIKAKHLREVKSPFEVDEEAPKSQDEFVPPVLPKNLPPDYHQRREAGPALGEQSCPLSAPSSSTFAQRVGFDSGRLKPSGVDKSTGGTILSGKPPSTGSLLMQGAATSSQTGLSIPSGPGNDVKITHFATGEKRKVFKEQLLKRHESIGPVKRYVRPTMVGGDNSGASQHPISQPRPDASHPNTVAAVTAAAVAATLPIVKAQSDLESKMDAMMERLSHLHEVTNTAAQVPAQESQQPATTGVQPSNDQTSELQRRLDAAVDRRLLQLEKIQERQLEWQERLLMTNQHPVQRLEGQPNRLGSAPPTLNPNRMVENGVRSEITDSSSMGKENTRQSHALLGQPEGSLALPVAQQSSNRNGSHGLLRRAVRQEDERPSDYRKHVKLDTTQATEPISQKHRRYTPAVTLHREEAIHESQPEPNPPVEGLRARGSDAESGSGKVAQQPSPLDTPAPRRHAPQPLTQNPPPKMTRAGRGLLEEILTSHDEEERRMPTRGRQTHPPPATSVRGLTSPQYDAETKAASLAQQLSKLGRELKGMKADLVENLHTGATDAVVERSPKHLPSNKSHCELHEEAERDWDKLMQRRLQPAPIDIYLRKPQSVPVMFPASSSIAKQPLSPSQYNAPVHPSICAEAKAVLDRVQASRAQLDANLEAVVRAKEQEEFYNYLDSLYQEGEAAEKARLRYKVGRMIAQLDEESKLEAGKPKKPRPSGNVPEKDAPASSSRPLQARGKKGPVSARIDSGLRRLQEPTAGRERNRAGEKHNKENEAQPKKIPVRRGKKQQPVDHNQDEAYLTRVYGKALYQARRSTIQKEPYLKYAASSPPTKLSRTPSAVQVKGTEMKSAKIQTDASSSGAVQISRSGHQFYFDPYPVPAGPRPQRDPGASRPATTDPQPAPPSSLTAPSHGQLIPMAIPLAPPWVGGLAEPITIRTDGPGEDVVKHPPSREIGSNVAVVSMQSERKPQLTVQHLPAIDIDTAPPSLASSIAGSDQLHDERGKQEDERVVTTPPDDGLPQFSHYLAVSDKMEPMTEESEDDLPVPGISLPGRYTEAKQDYHGPPFPPRAPPSDPSRAGPSSDKLAGDIRRDIMESTAMEWIEQELMARMISELYRQQPVIEQRPISPDPSIVSSSNDSIAVDTIGPAGLQLFVDAGQAVDRTLVSALVQEVLEEKVTAALGQHGRDEPGPVMTPAPQDTPVTISKSPIPTPVVTPRVSPVHTPPRVASRVATPLASPSEMSPVESDTESPKVPAVTLDTTAKDEPIAAPASPVATPTHTPPPSPPRGVATPELSPRQSPRTISVMDGAVITPVRTPEPTSPSPDVEEPVELPPSPEPILAEEEPIPPTPTLSLPTPSTPTPSPSSVTTTQPTRSTETPGQTISEGEWLISVKSEGQVEEITETEPGVVVLHKMSTSSSIESTLMGAEDIEQDIEGEEQLSEGEISPVKHRLRHPDPVVALLAHLRQRPDPLAPPSGAHQPPATLADTTSLGEVSVGQCPALTASSEALLFKEAYGARPPATTTPRVEVSRRSPGEVGSEGQEVGMGGHHVAADSTMRMSQLDRTQSQASAQMHGSAIAEQETRQATLQPAPRIIQVVGKSSSPEPPRKEEVGEHQSEEYPQGPDSRQDPDESGGDLDESGGDLDEGEVEDAPQAGDEEALTTRAPMPSNLFGMQTMSDLGTQTLTPDAMNLEALLQSGYLSQTFSQSEAGTSDFESTRPTLGHTPGGGWAHLHGTQTLTEDSLEATPPRAKDKALGARAFSVTLPSATAEPPGFDLSQTISEGEIPAAETISDVSEISGGPL